MIHYPSPPIEPRIVTRVRRTNNREARPPAKPFYFVLEKERERKQIKEIKDGRGWYRSQRKTNHSAVTTRKFELLWKSNGDPGTKLIEEHDEEASHPDPEGRLYWLSKVWIAVRIRRAPESAGEPRKLLWSFLPVSWATRVYTYTKTSGLCAAYARVAKSRRLTTHPVKPSLIPPEIYLRSRDAESRPLLSTSPGFPASWKIFRLTNRREIPVPRDVD